MGFVQNDFRIKVTGAKELRKLAKEVAGKAGTDAIKQANKEAAEIVASRARVIVPFKEGNLKGNIKAASSASSAKVTAGSSKRVGEYAGVVHFGDPHRGLKPHMYLSDAVHDEWRQVYDFYKKRAQELADTLSTKK